MPHLSLVNGLLQDECKDKEHQTNDKEQNSSYGGDQRGADAASQVGRLRRRG